MTRTAFPPAPVRTATPTATPADASDRQESKTIRVFIADARPIFRDGLRKLVDAEQGLVVVGEAADGEQVLKLVKELEPDILLLDPAVPGLPGLEVLRRLRGESGVRTILFAAAIDRSEVIKALGLGARGVVLKDSTTSLLFKSIRRVMAGEHWVPRDTISDLVESLALLRADIPARTRFGLTRREREVLALIVAGFANRNIGEQLRITADTVKHHVTNIFDKTGASSRLELALFAVHHRLVEPEN